MTVHGKLWQICFQIVNKIERYDCVHSLLIINDEMIENFLY